MMGPEYTQVAIKTEQAAKQLRWIGAEKIKRMDEEALKGEQDDYQKLFGEELAKLVGEE